MPKVPHSCENHGDALVVCGFNHLFVADRAAGLDDGGCARAGRGEHAVAKRDKLAGIRTGCGTDGVRVPTRDTRPCWVVAVFGAAEGDG